MAAYNEQESYGMNRNFAPSFSRSSFGSVSEDQSAFTRGPFKHDSPVHQGYRGTGSFSSRPPQQRFFRFNDETRGTQMDMSLNMASAGNLMVNRSPSQNTFMKSELSGQNFQRLDYSGKRPDYSGKRPDYGGQRPDYGGQNPRRLDYGGQNSQRSDFGGQNSQRSDFGGQNSQRREEYGQDFQRPGYGGQNLHRREFDGQNFQREEYGGQNFQREEYGGQNFQRKGCSGQNFQRSEFGDKSVFRGSDLGNREIFSSSEVRNNMFSGPQMNSDSMQSRMSFGGGNVPSRSMRGSNMFPRPQMGISGSMFSRGPQFGSNPMSGLPMTGRGMRFPQGSRTNQSSLPNRKWNVSPSWRNRNPNSSAAAPKKASAVSQQNKAPAKKKAKKKKRISSKLKDDAKKLKPWMTDELFAEVKKKNEMYFKAKGADSTDLWQEFRLQRNKVSSLIKEAKLKGGFLVRKKKEDEDDGKDKPYSCDTCDRAFAEESKLEEHLKEHQKCGIDGCQFEAHPKVVEAHKKMQHDTGYAAIISKLGNAAEIEKWRNERKSHFPSLENVKKRQAEQAERLARGEVLETKDFGSKNEDVKDSSHNLPQTQQDTGQPEAGGEGREEEPGEGQTTDSHMEN